MFLDFAKPTENKITQDVWERYEKTRDVGLRNEILEAYLYIVSCNVRRMQPLARHITELEDLASQSIIELIACIDRYDYRKGIQFDTFASIRVRGAIVDYIRKQDWVPREARRRVKELNEEASQLELAKGYPPSDKELAEHLNVEPSEVAKIRQEEANFQILALEEMLLDADIARIDAVKDSSGVTPEQSLLEDELKNQLEMLIDGLNEQEKTVLSLYYKEELKLKEIAFVMGVTISRVSQIHSKAISKLKSAMKQYLEN
ncbi:MAG TPA: FliA/WhiG family RNA polymerase sigma factor [Clostridiales bacterium]|jgi:RNA polymerase sigma factor for flagellar operon FliA|nr:FliA/WhiG family RNA polymerase sigma factor [Clostridiales bacterium]